MRSFSPFSVQPSSAYLKEKEKIDLIFRFKTINVGDRWGKINVLLETGKKILELINFR